MKNLDKFTVVFSRSEIPGVFTAHLLEKDLVGQGEGLDAAWDSLVISYEICMEARARGATVLQNEAPAEYWPKPNESKRSQSKEPHQSCALCEDLSLDEDCPACEISNVIKRMTKRMEEVSARLKDTRDKAKKLNERVSTGNNK